MSEVTIQVGKEGLTEGVVNELKRQLEQKGMVRVKMNKNITQGLDREAFLEQLLQATHAKLIKKRGFVLELAKALKKR